MSRNASRATRPILIALIVVLSVTLCAALLFLFTLQNSTPKPQDLPVPVLTIEAGNPLPEAGDFFPGMNNVQYTGDLSSVSTNKPGSYTVQLSADGQACTGTLKVTDTIAPTATIKDVTILSPDTVATDDFISDIQDATEVTVRFAAEPDLTLAGEQTVTLVLTDLGNNETHLQAALTVIIDTEAPQFEGVKDILTYAGDAVAYRAGVTVFDDQDENPKLELDSSHVDLSTPGTYTVTYRATDFAGNVAQTTVTVTVLEKQANHVPLETIYETVDSMLAKFITEDMTDRQKAEAVYIWTRVHFTYSGHTDTTDYIQSAYQFLTTRKGDCFGFFALQKLMLERMNIPTIDVYKVKNHPGDSNHYWLLVSIDGGETYYHYDNVWSKYLCLVTDKHLNSFSKQVNNCFNRDESLYPPTPTEALPDVNKLNWNDPKILNALP